MRRTLVPPGKEIFCRVTITIPNSRSSVEELTLDATVEARGAGELRLGVGHKAVADDHQDDKLAHHFAVPCGQRRRMLNKKWALSE